MFPVSLICVGRLKVGPERELVARYHERAKAAGRPLGLCFSIREVDEGRARRAEDRMDAEGQALRAAAGAGALVLFDERGDPLDSARFAGLIGSARDGGAAGLAFALGGPDGHEPGLRAEASRVVGFGAMSWPHQLARVMACEQLYRAVTILAGHPYHRA